MYLAAWAYEVTRKELPENCEDTCRWINLRLGPHPVGPNKTTIMPLACLGLNQSGGGPAQDECIETRALLHSHDVVAPCHHNSTQWKSNGELHASWEEAGCVGRQMGFYEFIVYEAEGSGSTGNPQVP